MKYLFTTVLVLIFSTHLYAKSVLLIGDSHTAGPFGARIHSLLSQDFDHVVTLGHSSSAAYHWVNPRLFKLSGGAFNQLYLAGKQFKNPKPTHWREKVQVPKLVSLLGDNAYHDAWKRKLGQTLQADIVVIALGANDARSIADQSGNINHSGYKRRKQAITDMLALIKRSGAKCVWIAPPNGIKKSAKNQKALYAYLKDSVGSACPMMDSSHYKSTGCDGVHFSCSSQRPKAHKWAKEAYQFIKSHSK